MNTINGGIMSGRMNRRLFTTTLAGAGIAALTRSKSVRANADFNELICNAAKSELEWFAEYLAWPQNLDWHIVANAAFALNAVARENGLDSILESLYGQDDFASWAGYAAWAEGSWNAFWA